MLRRVKKCSCLSRYDRIPPAVSYLPKTRKSTDPYLAWENSHIVTQAWNNDLKLATHTLKTIWRDV